MEKNIIMFLSLHLTVIDKFKYVTTEIHVCKSYKNAERSFDTPNWDELSTYLKNTKYELGS